MKNKVFIGCSLVGIFCTSCISSLYSSMIRRGQIQSFWRVFGKKVEGKKKEAVIALQN